MGAITGRVGVIKWGYRQVATLGPWSYANGTITAQLTHYDEMGIEQAPLVVVVPAGQRHWRWPVRELTRDGSAVSLIVGPLE